MTDVWTETAKSVLKLIETELPYQYRYDLALQKGCTGTIYVRRSSKLEGGRYVLTGGVLLSARFYVETPSKTPHPGSTVITHETRLKPGWTDEQFINRVLYLIDLMRDKMGLVITQEQLAYNVEHLIGHDEFPDYVCRLAEQSGHTTVFSDMSMDDIRYWDYHACRFAETWLLPYNGIWNIARDKPSKRQGRDLT